MLIPMFLGGCFNKDTEPNKDNTTNQEEVEGNNSSVENDISTDENDKLTEDHNTNEETDENNKDNNKGNNKGNNSTNNSNNNSGSNSNDNKDEVKEELVKEKMTLRIFYQDINNNIYYKDKEVLVEDKAVVKAVTEELKKDYNGEIQSKAPDNLQVRNAKVEDGILTVDFGEGAFSNINLGSSFELGMINCIVNSYGYNLGVDKVILKVNGQNYASGHIILDEGDYFSVNYDGTQKLE